MRLRTSLICAVALGLMATGTAAQQRGPGLPGDGEARSNSSRPPGPETPPGDLTQGTPASQAPGSVVDNGYAPPDAMTEDNPAETGTAAATSATAPDTMAAGTTTVAMAPIPDTPENRQLYGGPRSHGGRATAARGN